MTTRLAAAGSGIAAALAFLATPAAADPAKKVAVVADAKGRLEVAYVAPGGALLRKRQNGADWDAAVQLAPAPVSAVVLASNCPTAVTPGTACAASHGRLEAFFIGASQQMYHAYERTAGAGDWSAPAAFFGTAKNLVVGQNSDGRLEVFWVGLDDWIYHAWQTAPNGGTWGAGALTQSSQGSAMVDPTWNELTLAQNANGKLDLYYGAPQTLALWRVTQLAPSGGWNAPAAVSSLTAQHAGAARNADGRIEIFLSDASGSLTHRWQLAANTESWSQGVFGESAGFITAVSDNTNNANSAYDGRIEVVSTAAAPQGNLMHRWENYANGVVPTGGTHPGWAASTQFGWGTQSVAAALTSDQRLEVMYVRDDGRLYHDYQLEPGEFWSGEYPLPDAPWPMPFTVGAFTTVLQSFDANPQWSVNDHTFVRGPDGRWRMFGIVAPNPGASVTADIDWMGMAVGSTRLLSPFTYTSAATCSDAGFFPAAFCEQTGDNQVLWAPHVIVRNGQYMMFYAAGDRDPSLPGDAAHWSIEVRTSTDLQIWSAQHIALTDDGYQARDPMVFQDPVSGRWIMYLTSTADGSQASNYVVKACLPNDTTLLSWGSCSTAYEDFHVGTDFGPTESPFVVERASGGVEYYYLFIGPRPYDPPGAVPNWQEPGYLGTDVFRATSPFDWQNAQYVGHIAAHAAEIIQDGSQWYVSSAGTNQGINALNVAPLTWLNGY